MFMKIKNIKSYTFPGAAGATARL